MIRNMKDAGMSSREIVEELGISRNTVSRRLKSSAINDHPPRNKTPKLDPYRNKIREFIDKSNMSAIRILEEIRKQGYDGGYHAVSTVPKQVMTIRRYNEICDMIDPEASNGLIINELARQSNTGIKSQPLNRVEYDIEARSRFLGKSLC